MESVFGGLSRLDRLGILWHSQFILFLLCTIPLVPAHISRMSNGHTIRSNTFKAIDGWHIFSILHTDDGVFFRIEVLVDIIVFISVHPISVAPLENQPTKGTFNVVYDVYSLK